MDNAVKTDRAHRMGEACEAVRREILNETVGTVQEVLCETRVSDGEAVGYTRGYLPCCLQGTVAAGETVTVTITHTDGERLFAAV